MLIGGNLVAEENTIPPPQQTLDYQFILSQSRDVDEYILRNPLIAYDQINNLASEFSKMTRKNQLWWLLRKAQAEHTLAYYNEFSTTVIQSKKLLTGDAEPLILIKVHLYDAINHELDGKFNEAKILFKKAVSVAKANKLTYYYIRGKQLLANTLSLAELYDVSMADLQEAYVEAFILNDDFLIATINETYGLMYDYLGEYEKSIDYYQKALDTYVLKGYPSKVSDAIYGLATTYRSWKKYDVALEHYHWYQDEISFSPSEILKFYGVYGIGMTLAEKGDCEAAISTISSALLYKGPNDFNAELYKRKTECHINLKQLKEAEKSLLKAENIYAQYPQLSGSRWHLEMIKVRSLLNYANKDYQTSFDLLNEYYEKHLALIVSLTTERVLNVRINLELERKNIENILDQQRETVNKLQKEKILQQATEKRYLLLFVSIFVFIMLIVFLILYRNHQQVLSLSCIDSLSKLYNRNYIFDYMEKLFVSASPEKSKLSILLMDIDNFKEINDTYGHPFGDEVIRQIARIGEETLRTEDVIGRVGGEEFLCVLPRIEIDQCLAIAKRLLENINQYTFITPNGDPFTTSVSIGIARLNDKVIDSDMLYAQADQALYQSKRSGKNRATLYKARYAN